jgi:hypothetical protein
MKSRINPYLLGAILASILVAMFFPVSVYFPSTDAFLARNKVWVPFAAYTLTLFVWMMISLRPQQASPSFWRFFASVLIVHIAGTVAFILYVGPLGPIHYILYGPVEGLAIAFIWQRAKFDVPKG